MKLLINAGVLALLAASCAAENGLRVTDVVDEKLSQPQKILKVDVSIDHGHVDVALRSSLVPKLVVRVP